MHHGALHWFEPAELDADRKRTYEAITGGPRAADAAELRPGDDRGRLKGPFNAMLFNPALGLVLQSVGAALRVETSLSTRLRELAILTVAAERHSDYEWFVHERLARAAGFSDDELATLRAGREPSTLPPTERLARAVVLELDTARDLNEEVLRRALATFGEIGLVELVYLVGYYQLLALGMQVFRTPLPDDVSPPFV